MGMKQILVVMAAVVLVGCSLATRKAAPVPPASKNIIADNIVDKAIRKELGKPISELTNADLEKVTFLNLHRTHITDVSLKDVAKVQGLKELWLAFTQITDAGLKHVAKLQKLEVLYLGHTQITDDGLKKLVKFQKLEKLSLINTQITDAGLKEVAKLKNLEKLHLKNTRVTKSGVAELKKALPNCYIEGP